MLTDEEILKFLMDKYNSLKDFVCQLHFEGVITTNQSNILLNKIREVFNVKTKGDINN